MPTTSAPSATASSTSPTRSAPCSRTTGSIPRARHCSTRPKRSALPPPLRGLMTRTGCRAAGTGTDQGPAHADAFAGAGPASAAGSRPRQPRPDELPHRGPDQGADDDVARVVHTGVDARIADRAGEQQQRRGGHGLDLGHRGGEREGGRGVPGGEGRRVRHRYAAVGRHARCVPVGPRAAGRELEPDVDQRRVQPHGHEPGGCGTPARAAAHRRHRGRDPEPELGPVGGVGEPAQRPVQRRRRGLGDRPVDR